MKKHLLTAAVILTLVPCLLIAGDCVVVRQAAPRTTFTYANRHVEEVVRVKELIVPILQPLPFFIDPRISYLYNGGNLVQVPFASASVLPQAQQQTPLHAAPQQTAPQQTQAAPDVDALIDAIEKRVRERQGQLADEPDGPPRVPGFRAKAPVIRQPSSILATRCASCHTGARAKGDFVIFDAPGRLSASRDSAAILDATTEDRMPPAPRKHLTETEKTALRQELGLR